MPRFPQDIPPGMGADFRGRVHYELLVFNLLMIPLFYLNVTYLVPRFFLRRKYWAFLVIQACIIVIFKVVGDYLYGMLAPGMAGIKMGVPIFLYLLITSFAVCYCLVRQNLENEQRQKENENENLKSELLFLRWQISPHFMFNALNNMVALARAKSDKLEPMLIRLSTLMRYMLYDTDEKKVPINREIEYLQSYIDLQSIRFSPELHIVSEIFVQDGADVLIEPMLLIPFVENAFKHGTGTVAKPFIQLVMSVTNEGLSFSIRNRYDLSFHENDEQAHGIGLANVQRRLNLLYRDKFKLEVRQIEDLFLVTLKIDFV